MVQNEEKESIPVPEEPKSGEFPETHLEREDDRWSRAAQTRDWLVLLLMMVIYLFWAGIIYFLEPGIR
jgi:hypothetical protein